ARQSQPKSGWNKVVGIAVPFAKERTMRTIVVAALALLGMALTDLPPTPARGVRTTAAAFRTAVIPHTHNALRPCKVWPDIVRRIPSPEPPMGHRPEVGIVPRHPGAIGGTIRKGAHCRLQIRFSVAETSGCE